MVAYARQKRTVARFEQMDATTMPFQHEFDAAVICLALHTLSAPVRAAVGEAMRHAVRAGGRLITLDYAPAPNPNLLGRISYALIERDERSLLSSDPAHYRHFQEFMQNGGLRAWVLARGEAIERQHDYWGGTVELVISRNSAG